MKVRNSEKVQWQCFVSAPQFVNSDLKPRVTQWLRPEPSRVSALSIQLLLGTLAEAAHLSMRPQLLPNMEAWFRGSLKMEKSQLEATLPLRTQP